MNSQESVLTRADVDQALRELEELSVGEYGLPLAQLLLDGMPLGAQRLQRLAAIVLKQKFATMSAPPRYSATAARRSWPWAGSPEAAPNATRELAILQELRKPGPWNAFKPVAMGEDSEPISWEQFQGDVDHERGLFKVLALYVSDRIYSREGKTIRNYLESSESRKFEAGLDLATLVFDAAITGPLAALLNVPALAVGVALVGIQYGYRKLTDPAEDQIGSDR